MPVDAQGDVGRLRQGADEVRERAAGGVYLPLASGLLLHGAGGVEDKLDVYVLLQLALAEGGRLLAGPGAGGRLCAAF